MVLRELEVLEGNAVSFPRFKWTQGRELTWRCLRGKFAQDVQLEK